MNEKQFITEVNKIGIDIDRKKLDLLEKYYNMLFEKNKVMDLTNIIEKESVYLKHFYDSLTLFKIVNLNEVTNLCDIGSGAGFPGIVIKIVFPNIKIVLIDSLEKRIKFLNEVIEELDLKNIEAIHIRAEDYARKNREVFDIVTSRAVAKLPILTELAIPMVKINGFFIAMKANAEEELEVISNNLKLLNSVLYDTKSFYLPFEESRRMLIRIKKLEKTNLRYPRDFKEIKKKPL
jgi:16S rRNA (guanine527-N7)-methyltransferase